MRLIPIIAVLSVAAGTTAPAQAATPKAKAELRAYVSKVSAQMRTYRTLAKRADALFTQAAPANHATFAAQLEASSRQWQQLATAFGRVKAPRALKAAHAKEKTALGLLAQGFAAFARAERAYAANQDLSALSASSTAAQKLLDRAGPLQLAWARSLNTALKRERIAVPAWLKTMLGEDD